MFTDDIIKLAEEVAGTKQPEQQEQEQQTQQTTQATSSASNIEELIAEIRQGITATDELLGLLAEGASTEDKSAPQGQAPSAETGEVENKGVVINVNVPPQQVKTASELLAIEELSRIIGG